MSKIFSTAYMIFNTSPKCAWFATAAIIGILMLVAQLCQAQDRGRIYSPDPFLKNGYFQYTIDLDDPSDENLKATLVSKRPRRPGNVAVLYLHGYLDYFFQEELGDAVVDKRWSFYALDLRRHGRSWEEGQILSYSRNFSEYFEEIDKALEIIRDEGHTTIVFIGHSTGGLIAANYLSEKVDERAVDLLVLNSPFLDFNFGEKRRSLTLFSAAGVGTIFPKVQIGPSLQPNYGKSIHLSHKGEWDFDTIVKPIQAPKVRAGWIKATRRAQRQIKKSTIDIPTLILHSCNSVYGDEWSEDYLKGDGVLNVKDIAKIGAELGPSVELIEIREALHDVFLSAPPVRNSAFQKMFTWIELNLETE
jgi:alpha-beta hydrolase superfamily lysophospholipase